MSSQKPPKQKPIPKPAAPVTMEDGDVKSAGNDERRRMAAQAGRNNTATSRSASGRKTVLG